MAVTTRPPEPRPGARGGTSLLRFDAVERAVHWVNAALFGVLIATGAALYIAPLESIVGRRALVENIHVYCGLALPVPLVVALAGSWGRALRADLVRLNRWSDADRDWMRTLLRGGRDRWRLLDGARIGKFNPGQKLNAAFVAGAGLVMLATGIVMRWYHPYPLGWRTGATFVHDWLSLAVGLVVVGHVGMALRDPDALRSIWTGRVPGSWARRHAPAWLEDEDVPPDGPAPGRPGPGAAEVTPRR
ncbi:MAG TPA: cytochrome b/b6 domain-containing protein [Acidimicrobiales bacterium]|nr:cytochrome b/b6 domain-containing protein [Acidimicrobiales bacterium]